MTEGFKGPGDAGSGEDAKFGGVVDNNRVVALDTKGGHGLGEGAGGRKHVWVWGGIVGDCIKVEEDGGGDVG